MNFYDDLQFVHYGDARHTRDRAEGKYFAGYYGVQFNYSGSRVQFPKDNCLLGAL